jgi:hypothetical protein
MAAEKRFDFSQAKENETPKGFRSTVSGEGKPGQWKILFDEAPSAMPSLSPKAPVAARQPVLAQVAQEALDEHFPLLIYEEETFGDFTFTVRLKTVSGQTEQMAGVAFRIQDEKNYYVVRVSSLGNNLRFYKFVNGLRSPPLGPELPVPKGVWHELSVECRGSQISVWFNGKQAMPTLNDSSFAAGKIGFWTKSDSVSYFGDSRINYTVREKPAEVLVRETLKKYAKLRGLKLYVLPAGKEEARVIGSRDAAEVGQSGGKEEKDCLQQGTPYIGKGKDSVTIMLPLRDRNGEVIAAVKVIMNTFLGQTEDNALARARPVARFMEDRLLTMNETLQ